MTLRPRYSLLTLLILTALVAGGVNWWYGPYRTIMSDPPTAEDQAILDTFKEEHDFLLKKKFTFRYEVERFRDWQGTRVLSLKMIPLQPLKLYHFVEPNEQQARILTDSFPANWPEGTRQELLSYGSEDVVCLLNPGRAILTSFGPIYDPVIVLTNQKNVYYLRGCYGCYIVARRSQNNSFNDPECGAKIQMELDRIPDPH